MDLLKLIEKNTRETIKRRAQTVDAANKIVGKHSTVGGQSTVGKPPNNLIVNKPKPQIQIVITQFGAYIEVQTLPFGLEQKLKNYMTVSSKNIMGYIDKTHNFYYSTDRRRLYLPRFGAFILKKKIPDAIYINQIDTNRQKIDTLTWNGVFKGNQRIVFDFMMQNHYKSESIAAGRAGAILDLEAGQGKSFLAMAMINEFKYKTAIITHNTNIMFQWRDILTKFFPRAKIGVYYGKEKTDGDIIVGIINSLAMDTIFNQTAADFYKTVGMCIFDECHEYCSPSRAKIFKSCQVPIMLGLSATPADRTDGLDALTRWNIGPILKAAELPGYTTADIPFTGRVHMIKYHGPTAFTETIMNEKLEVTSIPLMLNQLSKDPHRIKLIVSKAIDQVEKGLNTFIFADRRSYLEQIQAALVVHNRMGRFLTSNEEEVKITSLMGGASAQSVAAAASNAFIILTTYQFMGTGQSIPKMNSIILSTPRKSKSRQTINRIFRMESDYSIERQIIDIVDWDAGVLKNQWYSRKKYYIEKEYPIDIYDIHWKEYDMHSILIKMYKEGVFRGLCGDGIMSRILAYLG